MVAARSRPWSIGIWAAQAVLVLAMLWLVGETVVVGLLPAPAQLTSTGRAGCTAYALTGSLAGGLAMPAIRASACADTDVAVLGSTPSCVIGGPLAGSQVRSCFWEWRPDGSLLVTGDYSVTPPFAPWIQRRLRLRLLLRPDESAKSL